MIDLKITSECLSVAACTAFVCTPESGGINIFVGTVRTQTRGRKVMRLEFEAYENMALNEMKKIALQAMQQWPVHKIAMHHRTGVLQTGDMPVIIAVSAAHREAAFDACRYAIDALKQTVPIWKKEVFEDGEIWVAAHP